MALSTDEKQANEAITMTTMSSLELRTTITSEARLELWLEQVTVPKPAADEVVVRIDAAPLNPSDIILLLGPVDPVNIQAGGTPLADALSPDVIVAYSRRATGKKFLLRPNA
jgi:hypothetical protein